MALHPIAEANQHSLFGLLTADEFYTRHRVSHGHEFITNPCGLRLFTQWWTPLPPTRPIGIVSIVHGFTSESSWLVQLTAVLFAKSGFATCAIDLQGHGFSDGLVSHIPDINPVVDDCIAFFDDFRSRYHHHHLPVFLYAESLGGAVALYIMLRQKGGGDSGGGWNGLILSGAMCGLSAKFKPLWPLEHLLFIVARLLPTWRVVNTRGTLTDVSFKEPWKRKLAMANPRRRASAPPRSSVKYWYQFNSGPRLGTAYELLRVCRELQGKFEEVKVPFLIVHGGDDVVCDPGCVEDLYRRAASEDKTIKIYPGMWHQLVGEPQENVDLVFSDVLEWLKDRTKRPHTEPF